LVAPFAETYDVRFWPEAAIQAFQAIFSAADPKQPFAIIL
jgi:hypothetical protein